MPKGFRRIRKTLRRGFHAGCSERAKVESKESFAVKTSCLTSFFKKLIQLVNLLHKMIEPAV